MVAFKLDGLIKQLALALSTFGPCKEERALAALIRGIPDQRDKPDEEKQHKFNHADSLLDARTKARPLSIKQQSYNGYYQHFCLTSLVNFRKLRRGGMAERLNAPVLKTGIG